MNIIEIFLYDKIRSNYVYKKQRDGLTYKDVDILLYCRYFADADGWVLYTPMRQYMKYVVKVWKTRVFKSIILALENIDLIELRERRGPSNMKMKALDAIETEKGRTGRHIYLRLTPRGMQFVNDFDQIAEKYLDKYMIRKKLRAAGLKDVDDEFKELSFYDG